MKFLPNFFGRGQLQKMFILYPDPHMKRAKFKWRIVNKTLLSEYAFFLAPGAVVYTITDVISMHEWILEAFAGHPLFERLTEAEVSADPLVEHLYVTTEEGQKVARNKALGQVFAFPGCSVSPLTRALCRTTATATCVWRATAAF